MSKQSEDENNLPFTNFTFMTNGDQTSVTRRPLPRIEMSEAEETVSGHPEVMASHRGGWVTTNNAKVSK